MLLKLFGVLIKSFFSVFESELSEAIPVVHASIADCRIVGRLTVGWFSFSKLGPFGDGILR